MEIYRFALLRKIQFFSGFTSNRRRNCIRMRQISESEIEEIIIDIQRMNLNETKDVNSIGHVGGLSSIKEEYQETFGKQYRIPKFEPKENKN